MHFADLRCTQLRRNMLELVIVRLPIVALAMVLAATAVAQGNPLDQRGTGQPVQDPGATALPAYYEGDGLIVSIEQLDQTTGQIAGRIRMGENIFPYTASFTAAATIQGTFSTGDQQFEFSAVENADDSLTFKTGTSTYTMHLVAKPSVDFPPAAGPRQLGPRREDGQRTADAISGSWSGTAVEQYDDGTTTQFPVGIELSQQADGSYVADLAIQTTGTLQDGQQVSIQVNGRFTGSLQGSLIAMQSGDVTLRITETGQTQSLGTQQMLLEVNGGKMNGRLGNDQIGWTQMQLQKQGASQGQRDPRSIASDLAGPQGAIVLERVTLQDAGLDNMVSHSLLKPQGWQVQGGQQWKTQTYRDFVRPNIRITSQRGYEVAVYPGGFYMDTNQPDVMARQGAPFPRPRPGQPMDTGMTYMPLPRNSAEYVVNLLLPSQRPQAQNVQVVSVTDLPQIRQHMAQQVGNVAKGEQSAMADCVRVTYTEHGQQFEEDIWVVWTVQHTATPFWGDTIHEYTWYMMDQRGLRAPAGQLDAARPLLEALCLSIRPDPRYMAVVMELQNRINRKQLEALTRRHEIARQGAEQAWQIHQEGVRNRQASNERIQEKFVDYVQDVDDFRDVDGSTVKLPSLYSYVYSNGNGGYVLTNEPTYDPNDGSLNRWEKIPVAR